MRKLKGTVNALKMEKDLQVKHIRQAADHLLEHKDSQKYQSVHHHEVLIQEQEVDPYKNIQEKWKNYVKLLESGEITVVKLQEELY